MNRSNKLEMQPWHDDKWDRVVDVDSVDSLPNQSRVAKWFVWAMFFIGVVAVLIAGYVGWWYIGKITPQSEAGEVVNFTVAASDDLGTVADKLHEAKLIEDPGVFKWYVERNGGLELTPGFYRVPTGARMGDVLTRLETPPAETERPITFPEGLTIAKMGERLATEDPRLSADEFIAASTNGEVVSPFSPPGEPNLEGLLFPDTYRVSNADNEAQVAERMVALMERVADQENLEEKAADLGVTPYEIFIIASMIEREARIEEDRPKIARVIYNRLFFDMFLQIDATVYYGQPEGFDGSFGQLRQIDGPYNTYTRKGLPPTPIANPGRAAIRAALNPAPNPPPGDPICQELPDPTTGCHYLYYVLADINGAHAFAATAEQHQANVAAADEKGLL